MRIVQLKIGREYPCLRLLLSAVTFASLLCCLWLTPTYAADDFPDTMAVDSTTLGLQGTGKRKKAFITLYEAGLYVAEKSEEANSVIAADEPMALRLKIISRFISAEKMQEAMDEGFQKSTGGNTTPIAAEIDQFAKGFADEIGKQDVFDLIYRPGVGTEVLKNGKTTATVAGLSFKQALFGIWLSDDPVQDSLKAGLLGN